MRDFNRIKDTKPEASNRYITREKDSSLSSTISNVLAESMPYLRGGVKDWFAASDRKALFIGLPLRPQDTTNHFVEGVWWTVKSFQVVDQAIDAIWNEEFYCVFVSIRDVDEFAPAVASRIKGMKNSVMPKIVAFDSYVPKYLNENLIRSGVDKVVISHRLQRQDANH
ncbi:hypothetical protein [Phaeobacter sp. B1627]|uniref:hypothetical protein n=1 Tax=Phaeobacter sp. B1627 TaxID=2583809 RepID=UPI001118A6E7|nr:hypothetical protein [Phaeobacter sp. B1627]TNJ37132.1 hypothetical protein FGE21_19890 [Phaeobacter sp. B1627]